MRGWLGCEADCDARLVVMQGWLGCKPPSTVTSWYQPERNSSKMLVFGGISIVWDWDIHSSIPKQSCVQNSTMTEFISPISV